jgi:two-component system sensor histidine kinase HydH
LDENQMRAAFLNLLINAQQALKQGGEIIVETRLLDERVRISFTDTGPGMTQEVAARCFSPYFTTKKRGSGLGLPTTRRIVEDHGGAIQVQSEPGRGTRFVLELPSNPQLPLAGAEDGPRTAEGGAH